MNAPIITLFEAYGAGAGVVGPRLADALGVPFIGQSLSSAQLEAADPRGTGRINPTQFLQSLAFADVGSVQLIENPMREQARKQAAQVLDLVAGGAVILGRNATIILADRPEALHVKLEGPLEWRLARAASDEGLSAEQAALRLRREDAARAEISLETWGWDPRRSAHFDLVVNVATFGIEVAIAMILDAAARKQAGRA